MIGVVLLGFSLWQIPEKSPMPLSCQMQHPNFMAFLSAAALLLFQNPPPSFRSEKTRAIVPPRAPRDS